MRAKSISEIIQCAYDAGRLHDPASLERLKAEAKDTETRFSNNRLISAPDPEQIYPYAEISKTLHMLADVDHMIDDVAQRWAIERQAAVLVGQVSDLTRELAIGKTMYYVVYDDEELCGQRWKVDHMEIADISFRGFFLEKQANLWISMDDLDNDRIFWSSDACQGACNMLNSKETENGNS